MAFDPNDPQDITKLRGQIQNAVDLQEPFVDFHREANEQYAGSLYGDRQNDPETIFPEVALEIQTLQSELMARPPQAKVRTLDRFLKGKGEKLKLALNAELKSDDELFVAFQKTHFSDVGTG